MYCMSLNQLETNANTQPVSAAYSQYLASTQGLYEFGRVSLMDHDAQSGYGTAITVPTNDRQPALVLQTWEAVNAERDLYGVLTAVARVLQPSCLSSALGS